MNYAGIKYCDIANGVGCRTVLFVSGCRNHCKDCFQPHTWDFNYGEAFDEKIQEEVLESLKPAYVKGITLLGGEPFEPENQGELAKLLKRIKTEMPEKDVWCYTGFLFDSQLLAGSVGDIDTVHQMLDNIDVLVDGKFVEELKSPDLLFRGSSNQRIIDVKKSLQMGETVWLDGVWQRKMGSGNIYDN
jgi:anaerobic ribonucleoside-triphosphate reductase activating protein